MLIIFLSIAEIQKLISYLAGSHWFHYMSVLHENQLSSTWDISTCVKWMFSLHNVFVKAKLALSGMIVLDGKCLMNISTFVMQKATKLVLCFSWYQFFLWVVIRGRASLDVVIFRGFQIRPMCINVLQDNDNRLFPKCYHMLKVPCGLVIINTCSIAAKMYYLYLSEPNNHIERL